MARKFKRRVAGQEVSRETLLQTPKRAFDLLLGIGKEPTVRGALAARGLDKEEQMRAVALIQRILFGRPDMASDSDVNAAIGELDQSDETIYALIAAAFRRHPDAYDAVLTGITPVAGPQAVLNVAEILTRLDKLEATPEGRAALATLAKRGIDEKERKRLLALVGTALAKDKIKVDEERVAGEADYEEALLDLRDWFAEWAEVARIVVKRRDQLITLGLAERRSSGGGGGGGGGDDIDIIDPTPFLDPNKPSDPNDPNSGT